VIGRMATFIQEREMKAEDPIEPPKSLCGKIVNVAVWEEPHWAFVRKRLQPGSFLRMRNVSESDLYNGLSVLSAHSRSWFTSLPERTYEVRQLLLEHRLRVRRRDPFNPQCGVMPLTSSNGGHDSVVAGVPLVGLLPVVHLSRPTDTPLVVSTAIESNEKDTGTQGAQEAEEMTFDDGLARCMNDAAPQVFTVRFKVTRFSPCPIDGDDGLKGLCADDVKNGGKIYRMVAHLDDGNVQIQALSNDAVGRALFGMEAETACKLNLNEASTILKSILQPNRWWSGVIHSAEINGQIFFLLGSISSAAHATV
jgi:hypothetical protein